MKLSNIIHNYFRYAQILLQSVGLPLLTAEDLRVLCLLVDTQWENVAKYFMLRLALAPCVESLILLDRVQFLKEQGVCMMWIVIMAVVCCYNV